MSIQNITKIKNAGHSMFLLLNCFTEEDMIADCPAQKSGSPTLAQAPAKPHLAAVGYLSIGASKAPLGSLTLAHAPAKPYLATLPLAQAPAMLHTVVNDPKSSDPRCIGF